MTTSKTRSGRVVCKHRVEVAADDGIRQGEFFGKRLAAVARSRSTRPTTSTAPFRVGVSAIAFSQPLAIAPHPHKTHSTGTILLPDGIKDRAGNVSNSLLASVNVYGYYA